MPHPLSITERMIECWPSSSDAEIEIFIEVAPACSELSTNSATALPVPLYPESLVACIKVSTATIEKSRSSALIIPRSPVALHPICRRRSLAEPQGTFQDPPALRGPGHGHPP